MGMHPKISIDESKFIFDILFTEKNLINNTQQNSHPSDSELSNRNYLKELLNPRNLLEYTNRIDYFWNQLSPLIESGNHISTRSANDIILNLRNAAYLFTDSVFIDKSRFSKVFLDFGAGVYRPLCVASNLYCNGFDYVYAYEPFPIKSDFSYTSFWNFITQALNNPEKFILPDISKEFFLRRIKNLIQFDIKNDLENFSKGIISSFETNGIKLVKSLQQIPNNSIDVHFSNAVLEHISPLEKNISELIVKMKKGSVGYHIVDFADHRHYDDPNISPIQKYNDEIFDEINGLPPSEIETILMSLGIQLHKINLKTFPQSYFDDLERTQISPIFQKYNKKELQEHINLYRIQKNSS